MDKKSIIIGLVAGLVVGLVVSPLIFPGRGMMNHSVSQVTGSFDRHFIEQMIPHHEGAIDMAKLALEKSKRPEILSLANGIIEAQEREISDMKKWHQEWFNEGVRVTTGHMMNGDMMQGSSSHMNSMSGDLDMLRTAKDFDLEFIDQMIPHHEMAVMMALMLKGSTEREEMKALADNIITSQSREIEMMRSWAGAWVKK